MASDKTIALHRAKSRTVFLYDHGRLGPGRKFHTHDNAAYQVRNNGQFVRLDKDTRSKKERNRERRTQGAS